MCLFIIGFYWSSGTKRKRKYNVKSKNKNYLKAQRENVYIFIVE